MKKLIILLTILCTIGLDVVQLHAQQGFYAYEETGHHYGATAILPIANDGLLVAIGDGRYPTYSLIENTPAKIIKLSEQMEETRIIQLSDDDVFSYVKNLYKDPANNKFYYAIGKLYDVEHECEKPYLVHFDNDLNILSQTTIDLPEYCRYLTEVRTLLADDDRIYWVSSFQNDFPSLPFSASAQIYMKIDLDGSLAQRVCDSTQPCDYCITGDIFPFNDGSGDFGHLYTTYSDFPGAHNILKRFTRDLQLSVVFEADGITPINEPYGNCTYSLTPPAGYQSTLILPDGKLLYTDQTVETIWGTGCDTWDNMCSPIFKIDLDSMQIQQYQIIGRENDSTEIVWSVRAMDLNNHGELFHCCNTVPGFNSIYYLPKRIKVTKTDSDLNVIWQKSFWIDGTHYCNGVKAIEDGGCFIYGTSIKNENGSDIRSAFVFRLSADGLIYLPEREDAPRPFAHWPSPVTNQLQLRFSTDFRPARIELYDLIGRQVLTQRSNLEHIDMSQLPAGTYTMRVSMEDGKTYSDKVVKE